MSYKLYKNKGFTLIELILVVAIISLLAATVLTVLNPSEQIQKSNDSRRKSDLAQVQKALEQYYQDAGRYPVSSVDYKITAIDNKVKDWGTPWVPYMNLLPKDPSSSKNYVYATSSDGQTYYLYASLDRGSKDSQACNGGNACTGLPNGASPTICGGTCNYGVSSPNASP